MIYCWPVLDRHNRNKFAVVWSQEFVLLHFDTLVMTKRVSIILIPRFVFENQAVLEIYIMIIFCIFKLNGTGFEV